MVVGGVCTEQGWTIHYFCASLLEGTENLYLQFNTRTSMSKKELNTYIKFVTL